MPRAYVCPITNSNTNTVCDLFQINGVSGKTVRIIAVSIAAVNNASAPTNQQLMFQCKYLPATVSNGSGGVSITPRPLDPGDTAAAFNCTGGNTTPATSNGTVTNMKSFGFNVFSAYDYQFPRPPVIGPGEAFTVSLIANCTGGVQFSGEVLVEESGG